MKKLLQIIVFCLLGIGLHAENDSNLKSFSLDSLCSVSVDWDSLNTLGDIIITANPTGTAPYSYTWSTGESTQSININGWGGINYCVTVTDAEGCVSEGCVFNTPVCYTQISCDSSSGLTALPFGSAPFTYVWSDGSTAQSIVPPLPGQYCVTVVDATGCQSTACYWWLHFPNEFFVDISIDSLGNDLWLLTANPLGGVAPFTYWWEDQNAPTQSVTVNGDGTYCVEVSDATGYITFECITIGVPPCTAEIISYDSLGTTILGASVSQWGFNFIWNTGETTVSILPTTPGTYCVTATGNGCTVSDCFEYTLPSNMQINGDIYLPDSLNSSILEGIVELFYNDPNTNTWNLVSTVDIQNDPAGFWHSYAFGNQNNPGQYLVKVTLDPASPFAAEYLPTYYFNSILWDEANIIYIPAGGSGLYHVLLSDGQNLSSGSGNISGTVTEGDGFTANEEGDRGGDPRPNTSVLLFDSNQQPITHTKTNDLGEYSFANLPMGTYKLMVEIVGKEQAERWVTLTDANPSSSANDFQVTPNGIILGINETIENSNLQVSPNPTTTELNIWLESQLNLDAQICISRLDGTTVFAKKQQITKGGQRVKLDVESLSSGLYLVQVTSGSGVASAKFVKI